MVVQKTIESNKLKNKAVVFFDNECMLCSTTVQFILKHDKKDNVRICPLQSDLGKEAYQKVDLDYSDLSSFVLKKNGKYFIKSGAVLRLMTLLPFPWPFLFVFIIVPPFIRNFVYGVIAKNRHKWFGTKQECLLPTPDIAHKFVR